MKEDTTARSLAFHRYRHAATDCRMASLDLIRQVGARYWYVVLVCCTSHQPAGVQHTLQKFLRSQHEELSISPDTT